LFFYIFFNCSCFLLDLTNHPCLFIGFAVCVPVECISEFGFNGEGLVLMQMILQLALRLKELHALGYVHRDLKPANVMWLPRENRWTVIDFGCVARIGEDSKLGFSVKYAAPEVIAAYRGGAESMIAQVRCPGAQFL
jgi:hypothetical protein